MSIIETKRGGFGRVEIIQMDASTKIARKTLDPAREILAETSMEKLWKRFSREVTVQKGLPQDFFLPVLDYSLVDDPPWFTMPYASENFRQFIEYNRLGYDLNIFIDPLCDILNALESLHELDLKHRDLKPENVLFHDGKWKLSDLGLVSAGYRNTSMLTSSNSAWGSAPYTSPEQLLNFAHVTCAADIFSFGCVLHDIYVGGVRIPYPPSKQAATSSTRLLPSL